MKASPHALKARIWRAAEQLPDDSDLLLAVLAFLKKARDQS